MGFICATEYSVKFVQKQNKTIEMKAVQTIGLFF